MANVTKGFPTLSTMFLLLPQMNCDGLMAKDQYITKPDGQEKEKEKTITECGYNRLPIYQEQ